MTIQNSNFGLKPKRKPYDRNTGADDVIITLPVERPNVELPVIELILE